MLRAILTCALVALVVVPAAAAHDGGGELGFRSTVTRITPPSEGVEVTVLESDDRLLLRNGSGSELVVLGYEGEPYLRFADGRVHRNARSPATYLNDDRFGEADIPSSADPESEPDWEEVSSSEAYEWHDHRIHWMSRDLPPKIQAAADRPHHVFDWTVPLVLGGEPVAVEGSLDYEPPPSGVPTPLLVVLAVVLAGAVGAVSLALLRRRRTRHVAPGG